MQTSENGIAFLKRNEGYVNHVYNDNGAPAVGYGHRLLPGESFADGISQDEADLLLRKDLASRFEPMVRDRVPEDCTQGQFDALVDFVYNVRNQPTSLEQLLAHGWDQVPVQLPRWCHVQDPKTGEMSESKGLKARRLAEAGMFLASNS